MPASARRCAVPGECRPLVVVSGPSPPLIRRAYPARHRHPAAAHDEPVTSQPSAPGRRPCRPAGTLSSR